MAKFRLDQTMMARGLVASRSQAESYIRLGKVTVDGHVAAKPGLLVHDKSHIKLEIEEQYVSRAGLKLASVAQAFGLDFRGKTVLDVGSSTGGFTDYVLKRGAAKVIAVDVGTNQLHPSLRGDSRIELHEQTNILEVITKNFEYKKPQLPPFKLHIEASDIAVIDVSFVSLRTLLPHIARLIRPNGEIAAMVKPQFEAAASNLKHKGVVKNDRMRREILKDFETWAKQDFVILAKADSAVAGEKGNLERFYLLRKQ